MGSKALRKGSTRVPRTPGQDRAALHAVLSLVETTLAEQYGGYRERADDTTLKSWAERRACLLHGAELLREVLDGRAFSPELFD